jgi:hypothetical protein
VLHSSAWFRDVDLFAASETALHLLGQDGSGGKPADQLLARFRALIGA